VAARSSLAVDWPRDEAAQHARDEAVRGLLASDLTPDSAVRVALLNSRKLQAILEDLGVAQADLWSAGRLRNPTFFASARWPSGGAGASDVEFSLTADVLEDLLIPLRRRVARTQVAAAESRVAQAALDLAAEVRSAAYELAARQQVRRRLAAIAEVGNLAGDFARRQAEAGDISRLDLEVQQAAAAQSQLELVRIDARVQADRERLNELLGLAAPATAWTMSAELPPLPRADRIPDDLEAVARAERLDLAAADARVASARAAFDLRRRTRLTPAAVDLGVDTERNPDGSRVTGPTLQLGLRPGAGRPGPSGSRMAPGHGPARRARGGDRRGGAERPRRPAGGPDGGGRLRPDDPAPAPSHSPRNPAQLQRHAAEHL
jgi:cobalt-zinc-cadmium efflux system outer membrane protein